MSRAAAWSVDDIAHDALDLAQSAADRSGKSLNEWLNQVIAEQAEGMGVTANEFDHDARLEAVAIKLARLTGGDRRANADSRNEGRNNSSRRHASSDYGQQGDIDDLHGRVSQASAAHARMREGAASTKLRDETENFTSDRYGKRSPATNPASDDVLNEALAQFERRTRDSQKKATNALSTVAEWIEINEARRESDRSAIDIVSKRIEDIQKHVTGNNVRTQAGTQDAFERVAQRLQSIEAQVAHTSEQNQQQPVRLALARLENRMEALTKAPIPKVEDSLRALDRKLDAKLDAINTNLDAKVNHLADTLTSKLALNAANTKLSIYSRAPEARKTVNDAISAIGRRQRDLEDGGTAREQVTNAKIAPTSEIDRRLEDIAARLENVTSSVHAASQKPHVAVVDTQSPALQGLQGEIAKLSSRLDEMRSDGTRREEQQFKLAASALASAQQAQSSARPVALDPQLGKLRDQIATMAGSLEQLASRSSIATLENALRDLGERIEASRGAGAQENLIAPVEQLAGELRSALRDLDPSKTIEVLHSEIISLNQKVESIAKRGIDAESFLSIQRQTSEIRELMTAAAARPLPVENIERQISALSERIDKITSPAQMLNFGRASKPDMSAMAADIRGMIDRALPPTVLQTIEQRLAQLDVKIAQSMNQGQDNGQLADIALRMEALQRSFLAPRAAQTANPTSDNTQSNAVLTSIGEKLDVLDNRLSDAIHQNTGPEHLIELSQRMQEMQAAINGAPRQATLDLAPFETLLRDLSQKMEASRPVNIQNQPLAAIESMLQDFATRMENRPVDVQAESPLQALEPHLNQIMEKLNQSDQGLTKLVSNSHSQFEKLSNRIDDVQTAVAHQLEQVRVTSAAPQSPEVSGLVEMMRTLNEKIDIVRDSSPSTQAMGDMLHSLATKMDAARAPAASADAIHALEIQIQRIALQLEKADHNQDALAALENTVNELLAQIENGQFASVGAAEAAAKSAAHEALREALRTQGAAADPAMLREIDDLRALQQNADTRNHTTLHILHETLEKIVDRLASLEIGAPSPAYLTEAQPKLPEVGDADFAHLPNAQTESNNFISLQGAAMRPLPQAGEIKNALRAAGAQAKNGATVSASENIDDEDFLIEPGNVSAATKPLNLGASRADAIAPSIAADGETNTKSSRRDFIAAARRAAQTAARESVAAAPTKAIKRPAIGSEKTTFNLLKSFQNYSITRRKPLLLTVSALVLLISAIRILPSFVHNQGSPNPVMIAPIEMKPPILPQGVHPSGEAVPQEVAPQKVAPKAQSENPAPASNLLASPAKMPGKSAKMEAIDPTPTGSIASASIMHMPGTIVAGQDSKVNATLANLASSGNSAAQYNIAMRMIKGEDKTGNASIAAQWLSKAATNGLVPAQYQLGVLNEKGIGVARDIQKAKALYKQAAEKGNVQAMYNLAVLIAEGAGGKPDYTNAAIWFRKAADHGIRDAQYNLAILYARGLGVKLDLVASYAWFDVAARQGDTGSAKNRDDISRQLNTSNLAAAKHTAAEFHALPVNQSANHVTAPANQA